MRKTIAITLMLLVVGIQTAGAITAADIRWGQDVTSNMASNTLRQWTRDVEGRIAQNLGTGNIYYVDSNVTVEGDGKSWTNARNTLDEAVGLCTANNGDVIYVAQGHNEALTAADAVDLDVAGITVIGCGVGSDRPRFDSDDAAGEFVIGAASVRVYNLTFLPSVTAITHCIDVENAGDWAVIEGCEFLEGETAGTDEFIDCIQIGTTATNVTISHNIYTNIGGTGPNNFIDLSAAAISNPRIYGNVIKGEFAEAGIWGGAAVPTDVVCFGNYVENRTTGQFGIEFQGAATGIYGDNQVYTDGATTAIDPGSMKAVAPNWIVTAIDKSPIMFPAQDDGATNLIGVDDADNLAATTNVVFNADGSILERQEYTQKLLEIQLATGLKSVQGTGMAIAVWYVNGGVVSGDGKSPSTAFGTLAEAITAADNAVDDWILVMDYSGGGGTISLDDAFCHIIGFNSAKGMPYPRFKPATAVPAFEFKNASDRVELANLVIGGGDQTVAAITADTDAAAGAYGCYIHDCVIGRDADAPANDGINIASGADMPYLVIENCTFYGTAMAGCDQSGIEIAGNCTGGSILNNFFQDIGSSTNPAINLSGTVGNMRIQGNRIAGTDDTGAGWGITLSANCTNIFVDDNHAASSDAAGDTSAFVDSAADEANAWGNNYTDITHDLP